MFQEGLKVPGLKMVFGTDAVAGSHGRNLEELVYRIRAGGQDPMDAVISVTSLAAEALGLQDVTGASRPALRRTWWPCRGIPWKIRLPCSAPSLS